MKPIRLLVGFLLVAIAPCASAQDASAIWKTLSEPAFDPAKSARVENIELQRDRVHITLKDGMIEFTQPVNGIVFGAAFQGHAALDVDPPNALEAQQLERFTHEEKLHIEFSDATFTFTDSTFDDVAKEVKWLPSPPRSLAGLYQSRQNSREDVGAEVLPRLFQSILSSNRERTAFFFADMKTDDAGWIQVREDALDLEEVFVGRLSNWIGFTAFDTWAHFPAGGRSPVLANEEPLAKDDYEVDGYTLDNHIGGNAELAATATVRLALRASGEQVLRFSLDSNLRVDSVKDGDGRALSYFQPPPRKDGNQSHGDYVAVALTAPTEAGKPLTLLFHYQGKYVIYKVGPGNFYCRSSNWYPTAPNPFATRSNFEMTFEIPKKFILIATGDKVTDTIDGGSNITAWKSSIPLAVAGFAYGDYKLVTQAAGDVAINVYANRSPDELLSSIQTTVDVNSPIDINNPLAGAMPAMGNLNASNLAKSMGSELANTVRLFQTYFGAYP